MKPSYLFVLLIGSLLPARMMADPTQITPAQVIERAPQSLVELRRALEKLEHLPDYSAAAYVNAVLLINAADEYTVRKEVENAAFLYKEALDALRVLQIQRPDWQSAVISYRIDVLERKIKELASHPQVERSPLLTPPSIKRSRPNESVPDGWRPFEFNGQRYYRVPLSSASANAQLGSRW